MPTAILSFALAALACYVFGFAIYEQLRRWNIIDKPNARSSHSKPTVRGGGIGIIVAVMFGCALLIARGTPSNLLKVIAPLALLLAIVSFLDDLKSLPALVRLGFHSLAAGGGLYGLGADSGLGWVAIQNVPMALATAVMFLWLVGYTNAFNFMDGINGIASLQAIITAVGSAILAVLSGAAWTDLPVLFAFIVAGAAAGFLPHNFPRAAMFMGDVSSAPLGFLLACLSLWIAKAHGWWLLIPLALLHANFVLDTAITLIRRILRKEQWFSAHREHFYQRLQRSGHGHAFVTGLEMLFQLVVLGLMIVYLQSPRELRYLLIAVVVGLWLAFFVYCEVRFQRFLKLNRATTHSTLPPESIQIIH